MALLALLQTRGGWTGAELRARLEVSARTLRRDIDDLRELGYGIEATRGVGGGYRLGAGASVPPLTLTPDEAVAIGVGLRIAAVGAVTGIEESAARALAKLEQSLSAATRAQIVDIERSIVLLDGQPSRADLEVVTTIARAIAEGRALALRYRRHDGEHVDRVIEPHRIVHTASRWYLIAWEPSRTSWRTYRVDRIDTVRAQRATFVPRQIPDDEVRRYATQSIATAPYPIRARVRMHAPADAVRAIFPPTVAEVTALDDQSSLLVTGSNDAGELALYLGMSAIGFTLIEGDEVREALRRMSRDFAAAIVT